MLVVIAALVIVGVLAHLLFSGLVLGGLGATIRDLRTQAAGPTGARVRGARLPIGPRVALYGMLGFWVLVAAVVVAVVVTR